MISAIPVDIACQRHAAAERAHVNFAGQACVSLLAALEDIGVKVVDGEFDWRGGRMG